MGWFRRFINLRETVPYTNNRRLILVPSHLERRFGDWLFEKRIPRWFEGKILPPSHPDVVRVQKIAKNIIAATRRELRKDRHCRAQTAHVEEFKWEVAVVDDPICNAFCSPGGKIVVNTGVIRACKSDAEIAVNIGHEVGHVVARHSAEKFSTTVVLPTILVHFMPFVATTISIYFLDLTHSRRHEIEADYIGLLLSASAGYDPRIAPQIWERDAETSSGLVLGEYFSTHPPDEKRAQLLSQPKVMEEAVSIYREALSRSDL